MYNLKNINIEEIIKNFDNIEVLKQLSKTWRYFSTFSIVCSKFEKTEELLSILSTISSAKNIKSINIFKHNNITIEFKIIKELWDIEYKADVLKKILIAFGFHDIEIEKEYDLFLTSIKNSELDPILKFVVIYSYTLKYSQNNKNLMCIISVFIFKYFNIMERPILYPIEFINYNISEVEELNQTSSIIILKSFEDISKFGEHTIEIINNSISDLKNSMLNIKELKKFSNSKYFYYIFSHLYITITDFMKDSNIKRDKAARLLAKLSKQNFLKEQKSGKEKIYINLYMIKFLESFSVQKYIKKNIKSLK